MLLFKLAPHRRMVEWMGTRVNKYLNSKNNQFKTNSNHTKSHKAPECISRLSILIHCGSCFLMRVLGTRAHTHTAVYQYIKWNAQNNFEWNFGTFESLWFCMGFVLAFALNFAVFWCSSAVIWSFSFNPFSIFIFIFVLLDIICPSSIIEIDMVNQLKVFLLLQSRSMWRMAAQVYRNLLRVVYKFLHLFMCVHLFEHQCPVAFVNRSFFVIHFIYYIYRIRCQFIHSYCVHVNVGTTTKKW